MKSQDIRSKFLSFFEEKKHSIVPSAPMVLKDDPTLMFVNSGMAPFKEYFLGNAVPKNNRITDTQKCLRVSGKHNDLEEVGYDTYHHTLFEMLGNWSFGDYFKKEAIAWAWELLVDVYGIDKDILYVTVFEGSEDDKLPMDTEAYDLWKQFISEDRILKGNKKDNFWEMGDQGPCGPCSEIHVDIRSAEEKAKISGKDLVNQDHPQVVEIWNLVFMQYNRKANGSLESLPDKHIDTGMGFERLCMVLQGVQSNYDTDVFTPIIREIETVTDKKYGKDEKVDVAIRVISDHVRAVAFSIADGQLPSNTGAGYVIRRILRRAVRYGFTFLDKKEPFIYRLVDVLSEKMGTAFPEMKAQKQLVENVIKEEEQSFLRTISSGISNLEGIIKHKTGKIKVDGIPNRMKMEDLKVISGKDAFELYDTSGFPLDLTQLIAKEHGFTVDVEGFNLEMQKQKNRSRAASEMSTDDWTILIDDADEEFVGYDTLEANVKITRYRKVVSKKDGILHQIVLDNTPFYPEGGGQVGDTGILEWGNQSILILDTKKENNLILHLTHSLPDEDDLTVMFKAKVNEVSRLKSSKNHSATHLMHLALRNILGTHVEQKGSLVNPNYLRFDFSHFSKVSEDQLRQVEASVNAQIEAQLQLQEHRNIPIKEALEKGAMALFGEKYGDTVRLIEFGESKELCGGIHVKNTAEIWYFKIISEGAVAAGIRRIEAITGDAVKDFYQNQETTLAEIKETLKNPQDILKSVTSLQDDNAKLKKQIEQLLKEKVERLKKSLVSEFQEINGVHFLAKQVDLSMSSTKDLAHATGSLAPNSFVFLASIEDGLPNIHCYISKELVAEKGLNAGNVIRELGKYIDGNGGGQPFFASGKGKTVAGIDEALDAAKQYIE